MNSPTHSEAPFTPAREREAAPNSYSPSVPISVYRELAAELKNTKAMVDSLSAQNQQLSRQNQVLRQEFLQFAQSADQLRQAIEASQPTSSALSIPEISERVPADRPEPASPQGGPPTGPQETLSGLAARATRIVKSKADHPILKKHSPSPEPTFTEQRPSTSRQQKSSLNKQDMSGLWLATTILLIVVSAFGAGFLIMKPLLSGSR